MSKRTRQTDRSKILVNIPERLKELMLTDTLVYDHELVYRWVGGYESLDETGEGRGGFHYAGVYHPNEGFCETSEGSGGPGICMWCGRTLW